MAVATSPGLAAADYPSPPYDFAHPWAPHEPLADDELTPIRPLGPLFTPSSGTVGSVPLLIIYATYLDLPAPVGEDAAWIAERFFGTGFASVASYLDAVSFHRFGITPAAENEGAENDGVVSLDLSTDYDSSPDGPAAMRERLTDAAAYVDFASFDRNGDDTLTNDELLLYFMRPSRRTVTYPGVPGMFLEACGVSGGFGGSLELGGVTLTAPSMWISMSVNGTNIFTLVHELAHQALSTPDLYHYGVGSFTLTQKTCRYAGAPEVFAAPGAYERLHLGWARPVVVDHDGYYEIRDAHATGDAFVLYDPGRGTNDYFIVENRQKVPTTYDQDIPNSGLVIWRIRDSQYWKNVSGGKLAELMLPAANVGNKAWNPADPATPARSLEAPWEDGTPSGVAVRAISAASDRMLAYFDVPGPGALIDVGLDPAVVDFVPGETVEIPVDAMNTGDVAAAITLSAWGLPPDWVTTPWVETLDPHVMARRTIAVTVPADAPESAVYAVGVSASDPSGNSSTDTLPARVLLTPPEVSYAGPSEVPEGSAPDLSAMVRTLGGGPIPGIRVRFAVYSGLFERWAAVATTDAAGTATVAAPALTVGDYQLQVGTDRLGRWAGTSSQFPYAVFDRTPPEWSGVPQDIVAEATGPTGAIVTFTPPTASDANGITEQACSPEPGATFPIGVTQVVCTATDGYGNQTRVRFTATIVDTTPPELVLPSSFTVNADQPGGTPVTYVATSTDAVDGRAPATCTPTSGSVFAIGSTVVTCTATDTAGNTSVDGVFRVGVKGASTQVIDLGAKVRALDIASGTKTALLSQLNSAQKAIVAGNTRMAIAQLNAFIATARALSGKLLDPASVAELVADATRIRAVLGG